METRWKRPESVLVVVMTLADDVLMMRRVTPPHFWQSVTGSLHWGESPRLAAERELYEETGLRASGRLRDLQRSVLFPIRPAWRARYAPTARFNREHWFALELPGRRLIRQNPQEHREALWLRCPEALRRATSWTNRSAIRQSSHPSSNRQTPCFGR
ncbi:dihydroneopterin triphosphate diphosphatase [Gammaproteobacteria bacterium]